MGRIFGLIRPAFFESADLLQVAKPLSRTAAWPTLTPDMPEPLNETAGFLLIDKPAGITSHDVIDRLRRITGERRIGHAGTLDPFATGLLIVGVGRAATKRLDEFAGRDKEYVGTMVFGGVSDTQDATGRIAMNPEAPLPDRDGIEDEFRRFTGEIEQTPPMYSAKKIGGKKLYVLARAGLEIERRPVKVTVYGLELTEYRPPRAAFRVRCSSGTYVRTLAHDIGARLGAGAYLEILRRTAIGGYSVEAAKKLDELTADNWRLALLAG